MSTTKRIIYPLGVLVLGLVFGLLGLVSASTSRASCEADLAAEVERLHPDPVPANNSVVTKLEWPYVVRSSTKVPLELGHHKYYSATCGALFGKTWRIEFLEIYLL